MLCIYNLKYLILNSVLSCVASHVLFTIVDRISIQST